jgi:hypothetical protein
VSDSNWNSVSRREAVPENQYDRETHTHKDLAMLRSNTQYSPHRNKITKTINKVKLHFLHERTLN